MTTEQETSMLKHEAEMLQSQLEDVQNRLEVLERAESSADASKEKK